ncbi:class II glutamine amidotransferase [Deinococcus budaensis]|uniref:Glutamine phosphoribosylpyrophosphate amidotransferase n=1 Tax=Deinococcus budaensis TaxID=1665626 RepID=A0A7W8LQ51_9DEIO|nr:hypothetical protein [Deinococcus budaensis]MBB5234456.1 glutamine phosphoribosylpyrophosphate amidotransferase [Deinococcus budaensis]
MCGLYGFWRSGGPPEADRLRGLALRAGTRGPHAHGHATQGGRHVALGPVALSPLSTVVESVIGHARLATAGAHDDLACAQPFQVGPLFVAHNGTVPGASALAARHGLNPATASDSEVLALLLTRTDLRAGVATLLDTLAPGVPLALLVLTEDGQVVAARRGHPLHALTREEGTYLCSLPFPGSMPLPDATVTVYGSGEQYPLATTAHLRRHQGGPQWTP